MGNVVGREDAVQFPGWWGNPSLHSNHRIALLTKFPEHYGTLGWVEQPATDGNYNYIWPEWNAETQDWVLRPPKSIQSKPKSGHWMSRSRKRQKLSSKQASSYQLD